MTDVEFLDPTEPPAGQPTSPHATAGKGATSATDPAGPAPTAWPVAFWLVAAACALVAPFTRLFGVRSPGSNGYLQYVDGWGRLQLSVDAAVDASASPGHDVAYGVLYVVAAAVLVALAGLTLRRRHLRPGWAGALRPAAVAVAGALATLTAVLGLAIEALVSRLQPSTGALGLGGGAGGSAPASPTVLVGPMVWLSLAAAVAAAFAALLQTRPVPGTVRRAARSRGPSAEPSPDVAQHREDEVLT